MYINNPGHITKMAAVPIHVYEKKNFKNLLQNRWTDFNETSGFEFSTRTLAKCELYFKNASRENQHLNFSASRIFGPFFICKTKVESRK